MKNLDALAVAIANVNCFKQSNSAKIELIIFQLILGKITCSGEIIFQTTDYLLILLRELFLEQQTHMDLALSFR